MRLGSQYNDYGLTNCDQQSHPLAVLLKGKRKSDDEIKA